MIAVYVVSLMLACGLTHLWMKFLVRAVGVRGVLRSIAVFWLGAIGAASLAAGPMGAAGIEQEWAYIVAATLTVSIMCADYVIANIRQGRVRTGGARGPK